MTLRFGTDGVRGPASEFTDALVVALGQAAAQVLGTSAFVIGRDTRESGERLERALGTGLILGGAQPLSLGVVPTPAVAWVCAQRGVPGAVISASHNLYQDNGIKFFTAKGDKFSDAFELEIEQELENAMGCVSSDKLGKAFRLDDAAGRYIEFCKSTFPADLNLKGLKIVLDCANGAAYHTAPPVFHELGAEVIAIGVSPNGRNINDHCGATAPQALIAKVQEVSADIGIALDGDADRLQMVDSSGRLFNGDELLYVLAKDRIDRGQKIGGVVGTLMTNLAIENAIKSLGLGFERAKVGDRYVLELLQNKQWIIGGEGSGHLLCLDQHSTGDGTIAALQVLAAMQEKQKSLNDLLNGVQIFPQVLINVKTKPDYNWQNDLNLNTAITKAEQSLVGKGRVLIRASGTEPVLRVMVEANEANLAQQTAEAIAGQVNTH